MATSEMSGQVTHHAIGTRHRFLRLQLCIRGRLGFLRWLASVAGVDKLCDRQAIANATARRARVEPPDSPAASEVWAAAGALSTRSLERVRLYAFAELAAEFPHNLAALREAIDLLPRLDGVVDVCCVCGDAAESLCHLDRVFHVLRERFDEVVFAAGAREMAVGSIASAHADAAPYTCSLEKLHAVLLLCAEHGVRTAPLLLHVAGEPSLCLTPWMAPPLAAVDDQLDPPGRFRWPTETSAAALCAGFNAASVLALAQPTGAAARRFAVGSEAAAREAERYGVPPLGRVITVGHPATWMTRTPIGGEAPLPSRLAASLLRCVWSNGANSLPPPPPHEPDEAAASVWVHRRAASGAALATTPTGEMRGAPDVLFITYGDETYMAPRQRLLAQAEASGWFSLVRVAYERADAERLAARSAPALRVLRGQKRGGGYWLWKPLVVQEGLRLLRDGDVLVYADAGCTLNSGCAASFMQQLRSLSEARPIEAPRLAHGASWSGSSANAEWCRADAAEHVLLTTGAADSSAAASSAAASCLARFYLAEQVEANRLIILNCEASRAAVDEWAHLALARPDLFTDEPSSQPNQPGFREHRHDQALFSALMWRRGWHGSLDGWDALEATRVRPEACAFWACSGAASASGSAGGAGAGAAGLECACGCACGAGVGAPWRART